MNIHNNLLNSLLVVAKLSVKQIVWEEIVIPFADRVARNLPTSSYFFNIKGELF